MALELVHTSAPAGLKPATRGFCTVAATAGMSQQFISRLEDLSGYEFAYKLSDTNADENPANVAHTRVAVGRETFSVLSRVAFCGADYSGRTNKIAHHFLVEAGEKPPSGPAWVLLKLVQGAFCQTWDKPPQRLPKRRLMEIAPIEARPDRPATSWQTLTGDAGWAGVLAQAYKENPKVPAFVVFPAGTDILPLFDEALAVLPPDERWGVGFATYYTSLPSGCHYHWRGILAGSSAMKELRRFPNATIINLTAATKPAPTNEYTVAAREGRSVQPAGMVAPAPRPAAPFPAVQAKEPLRVRDTASEVAAEADLFGSGAPGEGIRPMVPERRTPMWARLLIPAAIVLAILDGVMLWMFHRGQAEVERLVEVNQSLSDRLNAAEEAWPKALEAVQQSEWAKQAADEAEKAAAGHDPSGARSAAENARRAAGRAQSAAQKARRLADDLRGALAQRAVEKANQAAEEAEQAAGSAERAVDKINATRETATGPTADGDALVKELGRLATDAEVAKNQVNTVLGRIRTSAKSAKEAAGQAAKASTPQEAKQKGEAAKQAHANAVAAAAEADTALKNAQKAAEDANKKAAKLPSGSSGAESAKKAQVAADAAAKLYGEVGGLVQQAEADAKAAAEVKTTQPPAHPLFGPKQDRLALLENKGFSLHPLRPEGTQENVLTFKVGTASAFAGEPAQALKLAGLAWKNQDGNLILVEPSAGGLGDRPLLTCTPKEAGEGRILECIYDGKLTAEHKEKIAWLVVEVVDEAEKRIYQCLLGRPEPKKERCKLGLYIKKNDIKMHNTRAAIEFGYPPWADRLTVSAPGVARRPSLAPGGSASLDWTTKVDGKDLKVEVQVDAKKTGSGQVSVVPSIPTVENILAGARAQVKDWRNLADHIKTAEESAKKRGETIGRVSKAIADLGSKLAKEKDENKKKQLDGRLRDAKTKRDELGQEKTALEEKRKELAAQQANLGVSVQQLIEAVKQVVKENGTLEVQDPWNVTVVSLELEFECPNAGEIIRCLADKK